MYLREGTRRLALLLGVVGAVGGCFVSYLEWQDLGGWPRSHFCPTKSGAPRLDFETWASTVARSLRAAVHGDSISTTLSSPVQ